MSFKTGQSWSKVPRIMGPIVSEIEISACGPPSVIVEEKDHLLHLSLCPGYMRLDRMPFPAGYYMLSCNGRPNGLFSLEPCPKYHNNY